MSTCPNSVVRCRFTAGLSSCVPRSRIGVGQWRRYATAQTVGRSAHDISESDTNGPDGSRYNEDNLKGLATVRRGLFRGSIPHETSSVAWRSAISRETRSQGADRDELVGEQKAVSKMAGGQDTSDRVSSDVPASISEPLSRYRRVASTSAHDGTNVIGNRAGRIKKGDTVTGEPRQLSAEELSNYIERRLRRRLAAAVERAQNQLRQQQRVIDEKWFQYDVALRMASFYPFESIHPLWPVAYSTLFKAKFYGTSWQRSRSLELDDNGEVLLQKIETDCENSFRVAWEGLSRAKRAFQWPRLALQLLRDSPKLAMEFLLVTSNQETPPPFSMVADCLLYLDEFHSDELKRWKSEENWYDSTIHTCLEPEKWPIIALNQRGIRLYLKRSDQDRVTSAFKMMSERQTQMAAETALCFTTRFTEFGDVNRALEAFQLIPLLKQPGFELDSQAVLRHCCKLLTLDTVQDEDGGRNFKVLPKLLELGVKPDRDMMNVVLSNAFKTGDPQLGLDMLGFMKSQGFELDSYTYLTLLTDAVARGDRGRVDTVLREIGTNDELRKNSYIASKIFHAHYTFTAKHLDSSTDPGEVFSSMLDIYIQLHDVTPLKDLLIVPPNYIPPEGGAKAKPSLVALYIMIATYFRCQRNTSHVYRMYTRFRQLVSEGHEAIAPLAETDHTYNEFLVALRSDPRALRHCVRIVEDMLHPLPEPGVTEGPKQRPIAHAKPTGRTWTILLSAFIYNRQPLAAEKIKEMMAKHGVEFNSVTWNIIINGYANAQRVDEAAAAIKMMEQQGFSIDAYTMKGLRYLRDPERLRAAIEELDQKDAEQSQSSKLDARDERAQLLDEGLRRLVEKSNSKS